MSPRFDVCITINTLCDTASKSGPEAHGDKLKIWTPFYSEFGMFSVYDLRPVLAVRRGGGWGKENIYQEGRKKMFLFNDALNTCIWRQIHGRGPLR